MRKREQEREGKDKKMMTLNKSDASACRSYVWEQKVEKRVPIQRNALFFNGSFG